MSVRKDILEEALRAVTVDRAATHGAVEDNFGRLAALWSALLGVRVTPAQVALMLIGLKQVRAWGNPGHADNWVDIAGYAACGGEIAIDGLRSPRGEPAASAPCASAPRRDLGAASGIAPPPEPAQKPITGPFLDHERQVVAEMMEAGHTAMEIARRLDRLPQGVGAVMGKLRKLRRRAATSGGHDEASEKAPATGKARDEPSVGSGASPARPVLSRAVNFPVDVTAQEGFSLAERKINAHLDAVGYGGVWDPDTDLALCHEICANGSRSLGSEPVLGKALSRNDCLVRWRELNQNPGDLDHQAALLKVLKHRAREGQKPE